jgi:tricorn protease
MNIPSGMYDSLCALEGRLVFSSENAVVSFDIATKTLTTLANGARIIALSADRKKLLVSQGPNIRVLDATGGPAAAGAGEVKLDRLTVRVDPVAEWRQIFEESWRVGRDFFYDPNIHGVNWKAIRTKYEARLPRVATRDDLTRVIKDMISEFNTGHGYVDGPGGLPGWAGKDGVLGADFEWDPRANACRIKHIFRPDSWTPESRSPLADVGLNVHDGDYLLKVRGMPVTGTVDPNSLLLGCGGLTEQVTVNSKPTLEGARTIQVAPISTLDDYTLRVRDWVAGRKAYVNKASAGRIAYVYVGDMGQEGAREFARDYYPNVMKPGIIVDVRGNGGGGISGNLLSDLSGKITGYFAHRSGGTFWRERWAPMG